MKILITGATGLLGSTLSALLVALRYKVVRHGFHHHADFVCDLTKSLEAEELIRAAAPDCVINLVAATNVDACEIDKNFANILNVVTVQNLVRSIEKRRNCFLIQMSTDQVYNSNGYSSEENINILNYYAETKLQAEVVASGIPSAILRTNFYGPSLTYSRLSFSDWLIQNLQSENKFTVFDDVYFTPLLMETVCEAINVVIKKQITGTYNLACNDGVSKSDFAFLLAESLGLDTCNMDVRKIADFGLKAVRPNDMRMDNRRIKNTYGICMPSLKDEIYTLRRVRDGAWER